MSRKQPKRRAGSMVMTTIAGIFIVAIVGGVGLGVASASSSDSVADAGAFGYDEKTMRATSEVQRAPDPVPENAVTYEQTALATTSERRLDSGMKMVAGLERDAEAREARDNVEVIGRVETQKAMQGVASAEGDDLEYGLPPVDWSVGKKAFMKEWSGRIDSYLKGSKLEGYGDVFAEAAWENGVDPRWSPAISNTESGKGSACFLPHNAWGWGSSSWDDWESAIRDHVAGLAEVYGYSVTYEAAGIYCPPNQDHWYHTTIGEMASI